ncbi:unnamed protein product [Blepharisma stoltei]|uniref:Kelch motif family protein n=1 Tax=Blepharisma stoltei TaxID=1481888 RepID=A0AAU9JSF3_9CILI|nr:unnamed protein product [Blepharisma stoltei]
MQLSSQNLLNLLNFQKDSAEEDYNKKGKQAQVQHDQISLSQQLTYEELKAKRSEILQSPNNPEKEEDYRKTCSFLESNNLIADPEIHQAHQEFINTYHHITSLYLFSNDSGRAKLFIYDTESEREEIKLLEIPEPLDWGSCAVQLPNGELFCYGKNYPTSGITLIIGTDYKARLQPSGESCRFSSAIYFNRSVYCFGGWDENHKSLSLSERFDLDESRWIKLAQMPQIDCYCHSIIFSGNILISGLLSKNLLLYSTDIDSFSQISYDFGKDKRKILINGERIYLIQHSGQIYESEIGDIYEWYLVGKSIIYFYAQVYWVYNKGCIYFGCNGADKNYYKFSLDKTVVTKL